MMTATDAGGLHSASMLEALLLRFPNGTLNIYDRDLRYLLVGGEGLEAVGLTATYLQGKTLHELFPPAFVALVEPWYRRAFGGQRVRFEVLLFGRDYHISAAPFQHDRFGTVTSIIVVAQELTAETERQRLDESAPQD
jgi:PAS domain-containing protein